MNTLEMNVASPCSVEIGFSGENEVSEVVFDYSDWVTDFGDGTLTLVLIRPGDTDAYPVSLTTADSTATWTVSETDTATRGIGQAQLIYTVDDQIKKSAVFDIYIDRSITASAEVPDPYQTWLDQMIEAKEDAEDAAESAADSATEASTILANAAIGVGMTLTTSNGILTITEV